MGEVAPQPCSEEPEQNGHRLNGWSGPRGGRAPRSATMNADLSRLFTFRSRQ